MTGAQVVVDLDAYTRNLALVRGRVAPADVMAVVKADAYGHGLLPVADAAVAAGMRWIGCLDIATGLQLRRHSVPRDVRIFAWLFAPEEDYAAAIAAGIDLGVSTVLQLQQIAEAVTTVPARVHLKIDTGLHRNGADATQWPGLVSTALALSGQINLIAAWTHISEASDSEDSASIARFDAAIAVASALGAKFSVRHLAASAASNARADARFDLVRIGAFGYGISPGGGITPDSLGLHPVMSLTAPVLSVRGRRATIGLGYGHGIPSGVAGVLAVTIGGVRCSISEIALDTLTVEIPDSVGESGEANPDGVREGQIATLFGPGRHGEATLQEWADALGTIGEEIVTRLSPDLPRVYV